jgi:hypothetical protein
MRRLSSPALLVLLLLAAPTLAGCGDSQGSEPGRSTAPKVIEVTYSGDSVTPNGDRVEVATGQEVRLEVTADAPGEIHVHSSPEQELAYSKGTSTVTIKGIDAPGTVDVESHALDKVIVQLEVR